ncbi:MAG: beta-lactamase family protein, partial [Parvibaculaceae bacterium]|nr:beta-lactamase family protein [Parvibaculaceae bacterium]
MPELIEGLAESLTELIGQHHVPGAVLAIAQGDKCQIVHGGVANLNSGLPVTADTLFQIGSITKLYTATLALQLVDKGLLRLDQPVVEILPEFRLEDKESSDQITLAHLLSHTSGMDGDLLIDAGRGDDR